MSATASPAGPTRTVHGFAALERDGPIAPFDFEQREPRPDDVAFDVLFCGICHTDLHSIGPWGQEYPLVPGHEMIGRVTAVGANVTEHAVGDTVAVSVIVDSCGECEHCRNEMEIYCDEGPTNTYDGLDRVDGSRTRGGYAESLVAHGRFVHPVPDGLDLAGAAPLLCAGVTVWSPLRVSPGTRVVCLTASVSRAEVDELYAAGAVACIHKDEELDRIVAAIHAAAGNLTPAEWN